MTSVDGAFDDVSPYIIALLMMCVFFDDLYVAFHGVLQSIDWNTV